MKVPISVFFCLFTVSGFAGLIYESIWSHYLKLFLGHAAYAQTLVLGIFMGGMAIGAWLVGRYGSRIKSALLGYAAAEFMIGVFALLFHTIFTSVTGWMFDAVIPALGSPGIVSAVKFFTAACLILPPAILLGATFPLMSTGIMRAYADKNGECLPVLYFTNSLGAALGVLGAGFLLIEKVGLPGTIFTAGLINVGLAFVVWVFSKKVNEEGVAFPTPADLNKDKDASRSGIITIVYAAAFVTGAASFMLEIAWIRMLSMAIGASTHSFEVMLSSFILGIALGGLALSVFGARIRNGARALAGVIIVKCFLALAAVALYPSLLDLVQGLYKGLSKTENGYTLFLLGSYGVSSLMMIPTAICAGMTLPLATKLLLELRVGERAVGQVYAANTLGAILGTFAATHVGLELIGVKGLTLVAAATEISVAIVILLVIGKVGKGIFLWPVLPALLVFPGYSFALDLNKLKMASGVFRFGEFLTPDRSKVLFYEDGKTATVSVVETEGFVEIRTNGKTDAAVSMRDSSRLTPDEYTMDLAAVLPFLYKPDATEVANIGFGSGLTTHMLLGNPGIKRVDSIEIESKIIEGARAFGERNARAYLDPRSVIHIEDAKTFFAAQKAQYDVIISEPSNPWISGVATLFSDEFYSRIKSHIRPDGVLVQWVQLYDTKPYIIASILKSLGGHFSDYVIYSSNPGDLIIVAKPTGQLPGELADPFLIPAWKQSLGRLGFASAADFGLLRIASKRSFDPLVRTFAVPKNSDYFPVVDLNAPRERFVGSSGAELVQLGRSFVPVVALIEGEHAPTIPQLQMGGRRAGLVDKNGVYLEQALVARDVAEAVSKPGYYPAQPLPKRVIERIEFLRALAKSCTREQAPLWLDAAEEVTRLMAGVLSGADVAIVFDGLIKSDCVSKLDDLGKARVDLIRAILARTPAAIEETAGRLLDQSRFVQLDKADQETVVLSSVMAKVAQSKHEEARRHVAGLIQQGHWPPSLSGNFVAAQANSGFWYTK